jgi:acyl carrier protein
MKKSEFIQEIIEFCEFERSDFQLNTELKSIDGYDSLKILAIIAFADENFDIKLTSKQIQGLTNFNSLIKLIGEEKFEND